MSTPNNAAAIQTGAQTALKAEAKDGGKLAAAKLETEMQEAHQAADSLAEGQTMYTKLGDTVFNCLADNGKPICFAGGCFVVEDSDPNAEAYKDALDYHTACGTLTKQVG